MPSGDPLNCGQMGSLNPLKNTTSLFTTVIQLQIIVTTDIMITPKLSKLKLCADYRGCTLFNDCSKMWLAVALWIIDSSACTQILERTMWIKYYHTIWVYIVHIINPSPLDKMAVFSKTIFSHSFSWMKSFVLWLKFHWSFCTRVQLTITRHWFR